MQEEFISKALQFHSSQLVYSTAIGICSLHWWCRFCKEH